MNEAPPIRRSWVFLAALLVAFASAGFRLVDLQVMRHDELLDRARDNTSRSYLRPAPRGEIRDIRGNLLATTRLVKTVCADPTLICNTNIGNRQEEVAALLAPLLEEPKEELLEKLRLRTLTNRSGKVVYDSYVTLKRRIPTEQWERVQQALTNSTFGLDPKLLPRRSREHFILLRERAVFAEDDQQREYPNQTLAAHVLGFVGRAERVYPQGILNEMVGLEGAECSMNKALTGVPGWVVTETDRDRKELPAWRVQDVAPKPGLSAILTLDLGLQSIVESELADANEKLRPVSISATIVRPSTGEILAMATVPTFDPNRPGEYSDACRRNRVVCDISEPGSTFKVVVVASALNDGAVTLQDSFFCENGSFYYAGRLLHDHERYGTLTVEQIITKSSNIGAAKIGMRMGEASPLRSHPRFRLWPVDWNSAARGSARDGSPAPQMGEDLDLARSHGARDRFDAAANGHGHERHRQPGRVDETPGGEPV